MLPGFLLGKKDRGEFGMTQGNTTNEEAEGVENFIINLFPFLVGHPFTLDKRPKKNLNRFYFLGGMIFEHSLRGNYKGSKATQPCAIQASLVPAKVQVRSLCVAL